MNKGFGWEMVGMGSVGGGGVGVCEGREGWGRDGGGWDIWGERMRGLDGRGGWGEEEGESQRG